MIPAYNPSAYNLGETIKYYPRYGIWVQKLGLKTARTNMKPARRYLFGIFIEDGNKLKSIQTTQFHLKRVIKCLNLSLSVDAGKNEETFDKEAEHCLGDR